MELICVGSCGLHTLHNAFKCGFSAWQLDKLLKAMHTLFLNVSARRRGLHHSNQVYCVPPFFCAHRWVENLPVVERALKVWPSLLLYMESVKSKKLSNPGTASYVAAAMKDPLILAKLQFYVALARTFTPFLKKYQTDEPVLPFLPKDLTELMRRFIKREVLHDITALQLTKLDVTDKTIWLSPQDISIGLGAESVLKEMKEAEECLQELKVKRRRIQEVCEGLADRLAKEAERKAGSKMADLISRSNLLRRVHKERLTLLAVHGPVHTAGKSGPNPIFLGSSDQVRLLQE
ncbi:uncharacterized protein LOC113639434 isoform X2 [Tachysurus fulvidraco]|uniref:uncharacterized protein LOC113639434 isoform X2 n=1 Tax=Tachysurus fulvidraco TaxID=1234273 RepID=UPI001FEF7CC2|nr:uncharacterized protein LOC113639434 isoform X2 [Tachysurus fulvidraco]XP_047678990.1 uncharacterized protein LOC113639434 isoform X2 [Tachysurus fulvidraco]XP_047678991.1 uncharacterized protein LOC113639434 isoform X2 [Tachysurus fulvidraco]XP_047678992.1 uncharacterized protein LOC113639434 isoform X2 [Tachysurus fulvidraco]XP_047678993.1 uncharacterized protein LOC113639434 isoform X2 [Tachysurus fulvidraco]